MKTIEGLSLVHALREEMKYDIFFTQACLNVSAEDAEALTRLIVKCRQLRSTKMPDNERAAHEHIKMIERGATGKHKPRLIHEKRCALGDKPRYNSKPAQSAGPAVTVHRVKPETVLAIHGDHISRVRRRRVE